MYDEEQIWKKFQINRTLLDKWRKWYYKHFESPYYSTPNHGKGRIPPSEKQRTEETAKTRSKYAEKREAENPWLRNPSGHSRSRLQATYKKKWQEGVQKLKKEYPQSNMEELCEVYGKSRQAWYKGQKRQEQWAYQGDIIEEEVLRIRKHLPRCGGKKLYFLMKSFFKKEGIKIGRDKFFDVLRERNLLIKKKKHRKTTTNSNHNFRKYPNKTHGLKVEKANKLWVSDITYVSFGRSFYYLNLVMDAYSRKIVGWYLSDSLKAEGTIAALKMAITTLPHHQSGLIHHSDRGSQYCCKAYVKLLNKHKIIISMTENGDPYENILAERINRTIKEEFLDQFVFCNYPEAKKITAKSVRSYNRIRPHSSLDFLTPQQAHLKTGHLKKRWKNPEYQKQPKICPVKDNLDNKKVA